MGAMLADQPLTPDQTAVALLEWMNEIGVTDTLETVPPDRSVAPVQSEQFTPKPVAQSRAQSRSESEDEIKMGKSREKQSHRDLPPTTSQNSGSRAARTNAGSSVDVSLARSEAALQATTAATDSQTVEQLHAAVMNFGGCDLKLSAKNTVFSDGNPQAPLMIVGEAPGRDEDIEGKPFVGRAGQLLDRMLQAIERDRSNTYITNVLYWRPPGNRDPTPHEVESVLPFLFRHIELVRPKCVLTMGNAATKALRKDQTGIVKVRGSWYQIQYPDFTIDSLATYHPAYLLRNPPAKRYVWEDLKALSAFLG